MSTPCIICLQPLETKLVATCCGHVFHEHCLAHWLDVAHVGKKACPHCRTNLSRPTTIRKLRPYDFTSAPLADDAYVFSAAEIAGPVPTEEDARALALLHAQLRATRDARTKLRADFEEATRNREAIAMQKREFERRILAANDALRRLSRTPLPAPTDVALPDVPPGARAPNEEERLHLVKQLRALEQMRAELAQLRRKNRLMKHQVEMRGAQIDALKAKLGE